MLNRLCDNSPPFFFVMAVGCFMLSLLSRGDFLQEVSPALLFQNNKFYYVEMSGGGLSPGLRQFGDVAALSGANILANLPDGSSRSSEFASAWRLASGQRVKFVKKGPQINLLHVGWIPAGQRMALGIPLHPDQMTREDWVALPGIGEVLSLRIETDRQKNGDFASLDALERVKGIGKKRIESWRSFF